MRPGQNNNYKNRNRNRNRRHTGSGGGSGNNGGNPNNRVLDSNGPDVKLRGTPQTIAEKYMQLARDAHTSGDRVMAESYYQHADHYYRLWLAAQPVGQPIQFLRRSEEDLEDGEGQESDEEGPVEAGGTEAPEAAEGGAAPERTTEAEGEPGEDGYQNRTQRPREPRDQNGGGRERNRSNRWPRRNDRDSGSGNREGNAVEAPEATDASQGEGTPAPEVQSRGERSERPPRRERNDPAAGDDRGDWEAPSFLKRPVPVTAVDAANEGEAAPSERKPRGRRPRWGEDVVSANEPTSGEE